MTYYNSVKRHLENPNLGGAERAILMYQLGRMTRREARAMYNKYKQLESSLYNLAISSFSNAEKVSA